MDLLAHGICHHYQGLKVLDGIDLHVKDGEVLAIIGPSGCGKSTLLSILGGLLAPSGGKIQVSGQKPDGCINPITYVFQDFALLPWRTVEENVRLGLQPTKLDRADISERVSAALALMDLTDFKTALPRQLSGGMRQRVGIARALAVSPAILLMDEPLSALDAQTRDLLMEDFLRLWSRSRTTAVYVTHNLSEALHLADRVAVMSRRPGRVRDIVPIDIPRSERQTTAGQASIATVHDRLWHLIRDEAKSADRELAA